MKKLLFLSAFVVFGFVAANAQNPQKSSDQAAIAPAAAVTIDAPATEKPAKATEKKDACGSKKSCCSSSKKSCCSRKGEKAEAKESK